MSKIIKQIGFASLLVAAASVQAQDVKKAEVSIASGPTISCYVDTPAYDQFTQEFCFGMIYNGPATTTAVFQVFGVDNSGRYSFQWQNCTSSTSQCFRSIRAYRPLTVSVMVTDNQTGAQTFLTAHAEYERGF